MVIERGTPLAKVLQAQAADVREAGKGRLLEADGRKEIQLMVANVKRALSCGGQLPDVAKAPSCAVF